MKTPSQTEKKIIYNVFRNKNDLFYLFMQYVIKGGNGDIELNNESAHQFIASNVRTLINLNVEEEQFNTLFSSVENHLISHLTNKVPQYAEIDLTRLKDVFYNKAFEEFSKVFTYEFNEDPKTVENFAQNLHVRLLYAIEAYKEGYEISLVDTVTTLSHQKLLIVELEKKLESKMNLGSERFLSERFLIDIREAFESIFDLTKERICQDRGVTIEELKQVKNKLLQKFFAHTNYRGSPRMFAEIANTETKAGHPHQNFNSSNRKQLN